MHNNIHGHMVVGNCVSQTKQCCLFLRTTLRGTKRVLSALAALYITASRDENPDFYQIQDTFQQTHFHLN